ncbi:hypothetical protein ACMFMG_007478 [Clarireedia jacksonii]
MDVISLLNFSNVAAEQQKQETRQAPLSRNRTPWDAGGYSLPINTLNHTAISPSTTAANEVLNGCLQIHSYDSQSIETAKLPHHRFSDSSSSLSSFTSPTNSTPNSTTHSRFSSMSTVNSIHPFSFSNNSNHIFDSPTVLARSSESPTTPQVECHSAPASPTDIRGIMPSPTESLDALAALAEQQQVSQHTGYNQKHRSQSMAAVPSTKNLRDEIESAQPDDTNRLKRSGSPSDLMLIPRSSQQASSTNNGEGEEDSPTKEKSGRLLSASNANSLTLGLKTHKRTNSAPNFPRNTIQPSRASSSSITTASERAPQLATNQLDVTSPVGSTASNIPDGDIDAAGETEPDQPPTCMYTVNCDTGSQPRKAISHIFGRNKMCTRMIPQSVWVHYCRKHYQRSRYRNPKEYAKLQCALVQQQIRRVHDWSQQNTERGQAGTVQDWGLAVRKREQKRLDELNGSNRKRRAAFDAQDEDEDEDDEAAQANLRPATAVPDWLLGLCGKGYSTEDILGIFNRLHTEILEDMMPCFPDIEILPNIIANQPEPKSPKGYAKRKPANIGHKRSQSLVVGLGNSSHQSQHSVSPVRRLSQPVKREVGHGSPGTIIQEPNLVKRRRSNYHTEEPNLHQYPSNTISLRHSQASHRPQFSRIDENRPMQSEYTESPQTIRSRSYAQSMMALSPPLPAPVPQRLNSRSVANLNQFENGGEYTMRASRPGHQRSHSDMAYRRGGIHYSMSGAIHYNHGIEFTTPRYQHPSFHVVQHHYYDERPHQQSYGGNVQQSHFHSVHQEQGHMRHLSSPLNHVHFQQHGISSARGSPTVGRSTPLPEVKYVQSPSQRSEFTSTRRDD